MLLLLLLLLLLQKSTHVYVYFWSTTMYILTKGIRSLEGDPKRGLQSRRPSITSSCVDRIVTDTKVT